MNRKSSSWSCCVSFGPWPQPGAIRFEGKFSPPVQRPRLLWSSSTLIFPFRSYMVDAADPEKIEASKNELHNLLDKPQLQGIPVRSPADLPAEASSQICDDPFFSTNVQLPLFNPPCVKCKARGPDGARSLICCGPQVSNRPSNLTPLQRTFWSLNE